MKTGVIVMNFGEPSEPTLEQVVPFLERIFSQNVALGPGDPAARQQRARQMAETRAPGLIEEYEEIGGSPLNGQADAQAGRLEETLRSRGHDVTVYSAFQYTDPFIAAAVERARADGMKRLVGLPCYPMCGESTTVLALQDLQKAVDAVGWEVPILEISGWHKHPDFLPMWTDHVARFVADEGVDLEDRGTALVFSIHGTPLKYLHEGNRYDRYVDESCAAIATGLGVARYHMGYQNHTNRPIAWTQPDVETVVQTLGRRAAEAGTPGNGNGSEPAEEATAVGATERIVVVPVAFMHEQSETLAELDHELREEAEEVGLGFHRVPVPHDDPRFDAVLADLVEGRMGGGMRGEAPGGVNWRRCMCRGMEGSAHCTNGIRLDWTVEV